MSDTIFITAEELQDGDVWIGETPGTELEVDVVKRGEDRPFVPWVASRKAPAVMMTPVIIEGVYRRGLISTTGSWTLQPDQPLEVRRARADSHSV